MKKILLTVCVALVALCVHAQDEQVVLENTTPGRLAQLIGAEMYTMTNLKLTGSINNTDLKLLRTMAGYMPDIIPDDYWDYAKPNGAAPRKAVFEHDESECSLAILDVSECHFVTGGGIFYEDAITGTQYSIEKDGTCPKHIFDRCYNLVSLKLPNEFRTIASWSVSNCEDLVELTVGSDTRTLDDYAINNNWSLLTVNLPEGLTKVGDESIARNESLKQLILPNSLKTVVKFAFCANSDLEYVKFGTGLETLAYGMFKWCYSLEEIDLSETNVETIDSYAFSDCSSLTTVLFPPTLRTIGGSAFYNCASLETVDIPEGLQKVGASAFYGCGLRSLTLPNSVVELGNYAFAQNKQLTSIQLGTGINWIPTACFSSCNSLVSLDLPDFIEEIGPQAFMYCASLTNLNFTNTLRYIDTQAFYSCTGIEEVNVPDNVEEMGEGVFKYCSNLKKATIGSGIRELPKETFYECYSLSELNLKDGLETICRFNFANCESLHTLIIPSTVKVLENGLNFLWNSTVQDIVCHANVPPVGNSNTAEPWYGSYDTARVYVPAESIDDYIEAKIWAKFYDVDDFLTLEDWYENQPENPTGVETFTTQHQAQATQLYDVAGHQLDTPVKGLNIIRMDNGEVKKVVLK